LKVLSILLALAIGLLVSANAADTQRGGGGPVHILGWGARSCGAWNEVKDAKEATSYGGAGSWVIGFASSSNIWAPSDLLQGIDELALISWVDNYCAVHPLDLIGTAAVMLVLDLGQRRQNADTPKAK
jgi:hypothetical protein